MQKIKIAHSPDTDDIFMFYGIENGLISAPDLEFETHADDIETLNHQAKEEIYDITAISIHAYAYLADKYAILSSGASMAEQDWGPLLIAKEGTSISSLKGKTIAIPGEWTTANLLLKFMIPEFNPLVKKPEEIIGAVESGEAEAGLLIHEGQIHQREHGVEVIAKVIDQWRSMAGDLPLPLGASAVKKSLGQDMMQRLSDMQKESIEIGMKNFEDAKAYTMKRNPVLSSENCDEYLSWYVNDRTLDYGDEGRKALNLLFKKAFEHDFIPHPIEIEII